MALLIVGALAPSIYVVRHGLDLPQMGSIHDDAVYWVTAKSIADGGGYRLLHVPGEPRQTLYPPLYPSLLSVAWRLRPRFPDNAAFALWSSWLMLPLLLIMTDRLAVAIGAQSTARVVIPVWLALNPFVILYSVSLMSELMFSCMLTGCVWLMTRSLQPGARERMAVLAGFAGGLAFLTRTAGIFLLPAAILCFVGKRSYRKAILFAGGMLPAVAAWQAWTIMHIDEPGSYDYRTYVSHFYELSWLKFLTTAGVNTKLIFLRLAGLLVWSPVDLPFLQYAMTAGVIATLVYCLRSPGRAQYPAAVVAAAYLGMLSIWPDVTNARLLLPVIPLLVTIFVTLVRASWIRNPLVFALLGVAGLSSVLITYITAFQILPNNLARSREIEEQNKPVYEWLRMNSVSAAVATDNAALVYLRTGRPASEPRIPVADWYASQRELDLRFHMRILDIARSKGGLLLVHCGSWEGPAGPPLCSAPEQFRDIHLIAKTKDVRLFQVDLRPPQ